jgi:hypothetical protein
MARKTNTSAVEAYIDAALTAATDERSHARVGGRAAVSEDVSLTIVDTLRAQLTREIRLYWGTALLALLPVLVIMARMSLTALPQLGITADRWLPWAFGGISIAAALWATLAALWQVRNAWRRARGRPPGYPPGMPQIRRDQRASERRRYKELPTAEEVGTKLGVALASLPALFWLALSGSSEPLWLLRVLVALPLVFLVVALALRVFLNLLGAVGGVDGGSPSPLPASAPEIAALDDRIVRLQQIRDWLKDDKLKSMIDDVIGKQVAKSERRQVAYSVTIGALSLVVGWLLSAISPVSALAQLLPR